jgi:tetratricopeptide (TPR) repeat protein
MNRKHIYAALSLILMLGAATAFCVANQDKSAATTESASVPVPQIHLDDQAIFYYGSKEKATQALIYEEYFKAGQNAFGSKNFAEAERQFAAALKQRNDNDEQSAQWLSKTYLAEGKTEQAETLGEKIAKRAEASDDKIGALDCLASLSELYRAQLKYEKAESTLRRELSIAEKEFDEDVINKKDGNWTGVSYLVSSMIHLAVVLQEQHKDAEAEGLIKRALRLEEAGIGGFNPEDPDLILDMVMQADLYRQEKRDSKFEAQLFKSLRMDNAPDVVIRLNNIAALCFAEGKYSQAEKILEDSLEQSHACPFPATEANILKNLAEEYIAEGKFKEADAKIKEALAKSKESLGDKHPDVSKILDVQKELAKKQLKG